MSGPILHGGGVSQASAHFGGNPADWLDLSTGINPVPVEIPAIPTSAWHRLPDAHLVMAARTAAQAFYMSGAILPLAVPGTQAFIQLLPRMAPIGRPVAILSPTYGEYAHCLTHAGFRIDLIASLSDVKPEHGLVVIANPNNPDGRVIEPAVLLALAGTMAKNGGLLLVDEAFGDSRPELSLAAHAGSHPGLIVTRSFGKFFGLAGVRLGFVISDHARLEFLEAAMGPWPVSSPALSLAATILRQDRQPIADFLARRRTSLNAILTRAGLNIAGGTDLFTLVRHAQAGDLFERLCRSHILVRKFDYAPDWLRFGLPATDSDDRRLIEALG